MPINKGKSVPFNENLKVCRKASKLTQQNVADALGVNRSTYSYYEIGRSEPNLDTLSKLATIFNVEIADILGVEAPSPIIRDSSETPALLNELSSDEQMLILRFRLLSPKQKEELLDTFCISGSNSSEKPEN